MSTVRNGTTGASGTDSDSGYNLVISHLFIVFFLFLYRLSANTSNPYTVIMLLIFTHNIIYFIIFEIKIYHKIPKNLTRKTQSGRTGPWCRIRRLEPAAKTKMTLWTPATAKNKKIKTERGELNAACYGSREQTPTPSLGGSENEVKLYSMHYKNKIRKWQRVSSTLGYYIYVQLKD
jgi:hypothetical protein